MHSRIETFAYITVLWLNRCRIITRMCVRINNLENNYDKINLQFTELTILFRYLYLSVLLEEEYPWDAANCANELQRESKASQRPFRAIQLVALLPVVPLLRIVATAAVSSTEFPRLRPFREDGSGAPDSPALRLMSYRSLTGTPSRIPCIHITRCRVDERLMLSAPAPRPLAICSKVAVSGISAAGTALRAHATASASIEASRGP
jgi:hypothetical protein